MGAEGRRKDARGPSDSGVSSSPIRIFLSLIGKGEIFPLANQSPGPLRRGGVLKFR